MKEWSKNSLLGIEDLSSDEILFLLDEAETIKAQIDKELKILKYK